MIPTLHLSTFTFFLKTAWRNLVRGGQRVWVAVVTIAFGVMSLVAMTLVSQSFERAMVLQPRAAAPGWHLWHVRRSPRAGWHWRNPSECAW